MPGTLAAFPGPVSARSWAIGHLTAWPAITTLLSYKRRSCTTTPSHVDTPATIHGCRALVCPPRPSSKRTGTLGQTSTYQVVVYGRRRVYMKHDPPHGPVSLRDRGRGASAGLQSPPAGRRWQQVLPGLLSSSLGASPPRRWDPNLGLPQFPNRILRASLLSG